MARGDSSSQSSGPPLALFGSYEDEPKSILEKLNLQAVGSSRVFYDALFDELPHERNVPKARPSKSCFHHSQARDDAH